MKDLTQTIEYFKTFCDGHPQIGSFGYGPLSQLQTANRLFPIVWMVSKPGTLNQPTLTISFDIYILTSQNQDHSNLIDSMNDMLYIGIDMFNSFVDSDLNDNIELSETVTYGPITFEFDDIIGGWSFSYDLTTIKENRCYDKLD